MLADIAPNRFSAFPRRLSTEWNSRHRCVDYLSLIVEALIMGQPSLTYLALCHESSSKDVSRTARRGWLAG